MLLRRSTDIDLPQLREIYLAARRERFAWADSASMTLADFDMATAEEPIIVAVEEDRLLGFVSWWPPADFIHNLFVDPAAWRRGVGSALLAACLEQIGRPTRLKCGRDNAEALAFYRRHGWEIEGEGLGPDGPFYNLILD